MLTKAKGIFFFTILLTGIANAQVNKSNVDKRLKELGIELITPSAPVANYVKAVRVGNTIYLSGHGPDKPGGGLITGKVGTDLTIEQGQEAARMVGIALLSTLKKEIGNLDKVKRIVKVTGFVNAVASFEKHPQVMNGFSNLMVQVFGEKGKHARSSVGVASLPTNIPVEIEMIVEVRK